MAKSRKQLQVILQVNCHASLAGTHTTPFDWQHQ